MATVTSRDLFGVHHFDGFSVDVFGYDNDTKKYIYSVRSEFCSTIREAKAYYKHPDKRNEWFSPFGDYIYIIAPNGQKHRIQADYRP